jgi:hypothetical protein
MQVYPDKLKSFVEKATFNKTYWDINFNVTPEKVMSQRMSVDRHFAYEIEYPNFFENFSEPFDLKMELASGAKKNKRNISIALNLFNFECEKVDVRTEDKETEIGKLSFLHLENEKDSSEILLLEPDPPIDFTFPEPTKPSVAIKFDDISDFYKIVKKAGGGEVRFEIKDGKLSIIHEFEEKVVTSGARKGGDKSVREIADAPESWREAKYLFHSWVWNYMKDLYFVIRNNKPENYSIKLCNDRDNGLIFLYVETKDKQERYVFYLFEALELDEEFLFEPPEIPDKWVYEDSIQKVKPKILKWKNLTKDIISELYIAREVLSMSPSQAAKIMHGTFVPRMTWGEYCVEIGYSSRTVNRWLKRHYGEEKEEEQEGVETKEKSKPKLPEDYIESIKTVMDSEITETREIGYKFDGGKMFLDLQNNGDEFGNLEGQLKKLSEKRNPIYNEAIVLLNNKDTVYDWFKPCFDGVLCFIDHKIKFKENGKNSQGSCFVYFGENEEGFIKEFSKYGTLVRKIKIPDNMKVEKYIPEDSESEMSDWEVLGDLENS